MNYLKFWLIMLFISKIYSVEAADFQTVSTATELESYFQKKYNSQTLIIFDVDYVLITPKDKVFRFAGEQNGLRKQLFNSLKSASYEKYKVINGRKIPLFDYLMSVVITLSQNEPVDPQMAPLIAKLQKQNFPIIALTQNQSGPIGLIPSQSTKKINDLKEIGIEFRNSYFGMDCIILHDVISKGGFHPVYDRGVIFANGAGKGDALKAFLISQNFRPEKVIFIDDRKEYLESVANALKTLGIPYVGLQFIQMLEKNEKVDSIISQYQFNFLLENGIWLDDALAEEMRKKCLILEVLNKQECPLIKE